MLEVCLRGLGAPFLLLPGGGLYLPSTGMLLIADAHFGKAVTFRRLGVPVPEGTTQATLTRLDALIAQTGATQLVFLGDFLHSVWAHAAAPQRALLDWRRQHSAIQITLVRGNHDDRAGDPSPALGIKVVNEPWVLPFGDARLALCHHPQAVTGAYVLAGHWHPSVAIRGLGLDRLRLPCFWLGDAALHAVGVLPAFGSFTGTHPIARRPGDRVFALAHDVVRELPLR